MVLEAALEKMKDTRPVSMSSNGTAVASSQIESCLETVVNWLASTYGKEYFVAPMEEFFIAFGKVFADDSFYQDRMNYFLEYCILERAMQGESSDCTPLIKYLQQARLSADQNKVWQNFSDFFHSIFEVQKSTTDALVIKDLMNDAYFTIHPKNSESLKFITKRTIIQGYIFAGEDAHYLGQGLIIHPDRARKVIAKYIKEKKKSGRIVEEQILRQLALTNMRYLRMQHVDPANIYNSISG